MRFEDPLCLAGSAVGLLLAVFLLGAALHGYLTIWNTGSQSCRMSGRPQLSASLRSGRLDPHVRVEDPRQRLSIVLLGGISAPTREMRANGHYVLGYIEGLSYAPRHECGTGDPRGRMIAPTRMQLRIGKLNLVVSNRPNADGRLAGCNGWILLTGIKLFRQP